MVETVVGISTKIIRNQGGCLRRCRSSSIHNMGVSRKWEPQTYDFHVIFRSNHSKREPAKKTYLAHIINHVAIHFVRTPQWLENINPHLNNVL